MAEPDREFDAIVVGEIRAGFYGGQYAQMAPLFENTAFNCRPLKAADRSTFKPRTMSR